jgi:hypothetical protein
MAGDFVRLEVAKALEHGVRVIPLLVGGASMPHPNDLPEDLRALCGHQAMDLRDAHFHTDAEQLIDELTKIVPGIADRPWKLKSNLFAPAVLSILAVAGVMGGILWFRQVKSAPPANSDSVARRQIAPATGSLPSARAANPVEADKSKNPIEVAGKWAATVKYDWPGAIYAETFNFEVTGAELSGTASFLNLDRSIFDGKIEGGRVTFMTKSLTEIDDKTYQDKHYYKGTVEGDTIRFSMLTDSGHDSHVPVHFTAKRFGAK